MVKKGVGADSSHLLGLGWCGNGLGSNTAVVDVRDGKILRAQLRLLRGLRARGPERLEAHRGRQDVRGADGHAAAAGVHADRWIPVYPNTDLALQFAIAYVWITEGLYDRDYVETHTVGFDWLEYEVMGGATGVVKTPEWAEAVCGVPSRIIKALARKWHRQATTVAHCNGGGYIRSAYSHEPTRMEVVLLAMQGLGKPGRNQFKFVEWGLYGADSQKAVPPSVPFGTLQAGYNGAQSPFVRFIPKTLIPQGIRAKEPFTWMGVPRPSMPRENQFREYRFPMTDDDPYLHMIWTDCPCWTTCWNGGNDFIDALRSPELECVVAQHPWLENDCLFADLLLPVNTKYEERDIGSEFDDAVPNVIYLETQCIEPLGESKSDWEVACAVAERVGLLEEYTDGRDVDACIRDAFDDSGAPDFISWEEFVDKEYLAVPFVKDWEDTPAGYEEFCADPKAHPLTTPSGLLEIYSTSLAARFPDDVERLPYPHFIDEGPSHQESRLGERGRDYPFLMVSNHPRWRVHAQMDDIPWLREVAKVTGEDGYAYEPVWLHLSDAAAYGIADGDVVRIYNERGWTLGGAVVTERIMPGSSSP